MTAPLPCPFCGYTGVTVVQSDTYKWRAAQCKDCGAQGPEARWIFYEDSNPDTIAEENAISAWNARP